jgi:murein endopeptidase
VRVALTVITALAVGASACGPDAGERGRAGAESQTEAARTAASHDRRGPARALAGAPALGATPRIRWRRSRALGLPHAGRLVRGVQLPAEGRMFFPWDPVRRTSPNRGWRRHGTDRLVRVVLRVLRRYAAANRGAPRVGIGDLSRPRGGDFGPRFGLPGHVSHQNGLDVDVYYPRRDRRERPPKRPGQIDRRLAQALVDLFVRAGAEVVFVGPNTGLRGPRRVVQELTNHDNHLHVRLPADGL